MKKIKKVYLVKSWNELTEEEKEKEKEKNIEHIYYDYENMLYEDYEYQLEDIQLRYSDYFVFDKVYLDENSQGWWVDEIKGFKCRKTINIYGEELWVDDIDFRIRKDICEITENDVCVDDYYVDVEKLEKIQKTKKYKDFVNDIVIHFNNMANEINEIICEYFRDRYDITNEFIDSYFEDVEFEYFDSIDSECEVE